MLLTHRAVDAAALGVRYEAHWALHSRYRAVSTLLDGAIWDDALLHPTIPRLERNDRAVACVVLAGRCLVRAYGREAWVHAGQAYALGHRGAAVVRQEGPAMRGLLVEWDEASLGGSLPATLAITTLTAADRARADVAARALAGARNEAEAAAALAPWLAVMRAWGLPLVPIAPGDLHEPVPASFRQLAPCMERLMTTPACRPAMVDLVDTLGLSERHVHRLVERFHARYGFNAGGWRDAVQRARVVVGAMCMTAPGATTEAAAAFTGYASPTGFCHMLSQLGLPAPGGIARVVGVAARR